MARSECAVDVQSCSLAEVTKAHTFFTQVAIQIKKRQRLNSCKSEKVQAFKCSQSINMKSSPLKDISAAWSGYIFHVVYV